MEEQILHYYLKVSRIIIISIFLILILFYVINREINLEKNIITIDRGDTIQKVINKNITSLNNIEISFIKIFYYLNSILNNKFIHYGEFYINNKISLIDLINIITQPSNIVNKITIIEGWSQKKLDVELSKNFLEYQEIPYESIIADTYYFEKNNDFDSFLQNINIIKKNYFKEYQNHRLLQKFTENEIMTIGSLLEKEGLGIKDKRKISSVILNRLNNKMKLQIDATVIYALTNGNYNLNRKLLLSDLKIDHPFNTYKYYGLPPRPISYVGKKTLDIIFQTYETDFLFYFFNNSLNRHIFSITFEEHKRKLNEYRNQK